jgi:hypothetical protein
VRPAHADRIRRTVGGRVVHDDDLMVVRRALRGE